MSIVRFASSGEEIDVCLTIAKQVFTSTLVSKNYKDILWKASPGFCPQNMIVLEFNNQIEGFIRITPVEIVFPTGAFRSAALSSICIHPRSRGIGLSNVLMSEGLELIRKLGFDFCHLIARRAVDNYYNKFGFVGLSSYEKLIIKIGNVKLTQRYGVSFADYSHLKQLEKFYNASYATLPGSMKRSEKYWSYTLKRLQSIPDIKIHMCIDGDRYIGYFVCDGEKVLEMAFEPEIILDSDLVSLFPVVDGVVTIEIPRNHPIQKIVHSSFDVSYSSRRCLFGGHMVCDLNYKDVFSLEKLETHFLEQYNLSIMGNPSSDSQNFNIPFLDQL